MLNRKTFIALATASAVLASGLVVAQTTAVVSTPTVPTTSVSTDPAGTKLVSSYTSFAGSPENAASLVKGLRTGSVITLLPDPTGPYANQPPATLSPTTGKMGYGNINIALALAKTSLAKDGITNPTPTQLAAALGSVLGQRSDGMGWGQIAKSMGVTLGSVVSASHTDKSGKKPAHTTQVAGLAKADIDNAGKGASVNGSGHVNHAGGNVGGNGGGNGGGKK